MQVLLVFTIYKMKITNNRIAEISIELSKLINEIVDKDDDIIAFWHNRFIHAKNIDILDKYINALQPLKNFISEVETLKNDMDFKNLFYTKKENILFYICPTLCSTSYALFFAKELINRVNLFSRETNIDKAKIFFYEIKNSQKYDRHYCFYSETSEIHKKAFILNNHTMDEFIKA